MAARPKTMHRLLLAALVFGLFGMASADAVRHKKARAVTPQPAPVYAQPAHRPDIRPPWAAPQHCFTNDGYGRFLPCEIGDGR